MRLSSSLLNCLLLVIAVKTVCAEEVLSVTYPPSGKPGELALEATFHVWLPPQAKHIRAVIVHQHGCGDGAERF